MALIEFEGMKYIDAEHQFELTTSFVKTELNIDLALELGSEGEDIAFLREVRKTFYAHLQSNAYNNANNVRFSHRAWVEFFVFDNKRDDRLFIRDGMEGAIRYFMRSGGHLSGDMQEQDFNVTIDKIKRFRGDRLFSNYMDEIMEQSRLKFKGRYSNCIPAEDYRNGY